MPTESEVTVSNIFEADDPTDAVGQMAAWLDDSAYQAGYRVTRCSRPSDTVFIDAEDIKWNARR